MFRALVLVVFIYITSIASAENIVLYVNGASAALSEYTNAQSLAFKKSMNKNGVNSITAFRHFPIVFSKSESAFSIQCQKILSQRAFPISGQRPATNQYIEYLNNLGKIYDSSNTNALLYCSQGPGIFKLGTATSGLADAINAQLLSGNSVVIAGYSQGNLFVEAAIGLMIYKKQISDLTKIRVVNIATHTASILSGRYINNSLDDVIYFNFASSWPFSLPADYDLCIGSCSSKATRSDLLTVGGGEEAHFLESTYLNESIKVFSSKLSLPRTIADHVNGALSELSSSNQYSASPLAAEIGKDIIFTITGQNLTTGMGFAVDDCTPSSNELPGGTSTKRQFRCTINGIAGPKNGYLKKPDGTVLYTFTVNASITAGSTKWQSTITPPGYVVKQFINTDIANLASGAFTTAGEYRFNLDSIGCNLTQTLAISGARSSNQFTFDITFTSPQTTCSDGSHTAVPGYKESYTGTLIGGVLFVTPQTACSFSLNNKCYNFESFAPVQ
jgi:hypothetical protein